MISMKNQIGIKIITAVLLLLSLTHMSYSYYQFMRVAVCIMTGYLAYIEFLQQRPVTGLLCILVVILFQPVFKFYIHKSQWQQIDLGLALTMITWAVIDIALYFKNQKKDN